MNEARMRVMVRGARLYGKWLHDGDGTRMFRTGVHKSTLVRYYGSASNAFILFVASPSPVQALYYRHKR